ncbi:MAG: S8 family peptidase [Clostridiales bacterium]|nr:S8 family peptidase [Clostridiales bacterium]
MIRADRERIIGDEYFDLIIEYRSNPRIIGLFEEGTLHILNDVFAFLHVPIPLFYEIYPSIRYAELPVLYGLTDEASLDASRVFEVRDSPVFNLTGEGVIIGIIDTGIDYTNPLFIKSDGSTKILSIWDQSIHTGPSPTNADFGTIYTREQINQALSSDNPLEIVPSIDENGHGTMMAGIAVGNDVEEENFYGVAPDADLIVVKLRQAKQSVRDFFFIPEGVPCFQENHVMWASQYCVNVARSLNRPLVLCMGLGSSQGAHTGRSPLNLLLNRLGDLPNTVVVVPVGNEGNLGRHYYGIINPDIGSNTVELNVGESDSSFTMELWGNPPGIYSIDILSPSGEYIPRIPAGIVVNRVISFVFESTIIYINYQTIEAQSGNQLIFFRFENATSGIWRFNVFGQGDLSMGFHIWLPMGEFISRETYFIQPNIFTTVLSPGTSEVPISVTTYNPVNNNLYVGSSRGFTKDNVIKPEIAAPGVNYLAPTLEQSFAPFSGTSISAAHTAGVVALILEWGTVRGNDPGMDTGEIKKHLIRGARRRPNLTYPNRDWGFGILDVLNVFQNMRADVGF